MTTDEYLKRINDKSDMSVADSIKNLTEVSERFTKILKENQAGLQCWYFMVGEVGKELLAHLQYAGIAADIKPCFRKDDGSFRDRACAEPACSLNQSCATNGRV